MKIKGLTMAIIFQIENSSNGETRENVKSRRRILEGKLYRETYIPIQRLRYNFINQMGVNYKEIGTDKTVLQFAPEATIDKYPEIDLFGYAKTSDVQKIRQARVTLSNAVSLEKFRDKDEVEKTYYAYTISADLDKVGIDENDNIEIENTEKASRVINLLDTIGSLYIGNIGQKEYLKPLFIIGGIYDFKDAIFHGILDVKDNKVDIGRIKEVLCEDIKEDTHCGLVKGIFYNDNEILEELGAKSVEEYFGVIKDKVKTYYKES